MVRARYAILALLAALLVQPASAQVTDESAPQDAKTDTTNGVPAEKPAKKVRHGVGSDRADKKKVPAGAGDPVKPADQGRQPPASAPSLVQAPAPQPVKEPTGDFEPVLHARSANIGVCMDNIVGQSARAIDRPHKAISTWVTKAPNENVFSSIVAMGYPNKVAPNGAAVILAAPIGQNKCEGQTVQIYPTSQSCTAVQANLLRIGHTVATLENLPLIEMNDGGRSLLMPTAGGGCVMVTVRLR